MIDIALTLIYCASVLTALGSLLWACKTDFMTMTIPNGLSIAVAISFFPAYGAAHALGLDVFEPLPRHLIALGLMFLLTFVMFGLRVWGAGDSKLASAIALWLGLKGFSGFLLVMALGGLVLVVASVVLRRWPGPAMLADTAGTWPQRLRAGQAVLPYGIAIVAGALGVFIVHGYINFFQIIGIG